MSRIRAWVDACSATESATSLALFRIAIGLCTLLTIGTVVGLGLDEVLWVHSDYGGMRALNDPPWLIAALGGATPTVIRSLSTVALSCASL